MTEPLVDEFEICDCVIGLEADFGDQVDYDDALNILELEYAEHAFVDIQDAVSLFGFFFAL